MMTRMWCGAGCAAAVAVLMTVPTGLSAQRMSEREFEDRMERLGDRVSHQVERALARAAVEWEDAWSRIDWSDFEMTVSDGTRFDDSGWWDDAPAGPRVQAEDFEWRGRVDRGDAVEIKGISGIVRAVRSNGAEVEVVAVRSARRSDPESVRIEVIEHGGGVTLCALYPTPDDANRANACAPGDDGRMNVRRNDTRVEWEVRVPEGVDFEVSNINGDIETEELASNIRVSTVNGSVRVATTGSAEARTVNGDVSARFDVLTRDVRFETVNGSVELDLADDIDALLDAEWVNGSLDSEIPIRLQGRMGRRSARGALGDGGPLLRLRTVNGSIEIY